MFSVYSLVVIPVAVCRLAVWNGWRPPFGFYVFAGMCFASSGKLFFRTSVVFESHQPISPFDNPGLTNFFFFMFTRHSLIFRPLHNNNRIDGIRVTTSREVFIHDRDPCYRPPQRPESAMLNRMSVDSYCLMDKPRSQKAISWSEMKKPIVEIQMRAM